MSLSLKIPKANYFMSDKKLTGHMNEQLRSGSPKYFWDSLITKSYLMVFHVYP